MVFFTCSHCGESLKKNKVEKHYYTVCRGKPVAVSCVDCCKDFNEETVVAHTKCVTEEERYAAKGFTPKPSANKGERKQQRWQDVIRTVKNTRKDLGQSEIQILSLLVNQENVPRKRNKFQNYLKTNLHGRYKEEVANRVFDILEEQSKLEEAKEKTEEDQQNEEAEEKENKSICENEEEKEQPEQTEQLSKKERKELKKKAKYEAQLKQIEKENNEDEAVEEKPEEEEVVPKKSKKSKKSKEVAENNAAEEVITENGTEGGKSKKKHKSKPVENGDAAETNNVEEQPKSKKKRKKEMAEEEEEEEPAEKKAKDIECQEQEEGEAAPKQKFNWEKVIVSLLEAKEDKELSLKRLKKKVLAELESYGETNTEKNLSKFNKKILKIPGVVVLKDKVRLKAEPA